MTGYLPCPSVTVSLDKGWHCLLYVPLVHISLFLFQGQSFQLGIWGLSPLALTGADTPLSSVAHHSPTNERYRLCLFITGCLSLFSEEEGVYVSLR